MSNLLRNSDFRGGTYQPKGQVSLVLPNEWEAGWLDGVNGPRGTQNKCLKPEILVITAVQPYLDPPRTESPDNSVTGFKLYGTVCYWLLQQADSVPGKQYSFKARAHAWSRMTEDPNDAHYSHDVGTGAFYALEGATGLKDGQKNYRFRVGIDPFGGKDPFGSAVIWGPGAHIYNVFDNIPEVKASARADKITVFIFADCLYGMINSNSFMSKPDLEETVEIPSTGRGKPREDYERTYWVMPQDTPHDRALQIFEQSFPLKGTLGFSYDDAGIGDLSKRTAVLWDLPLSRQQEFKDWYSKWYPGVIVEFRDPKAGSPPPRIMYKVPNNKGGIHKVVSGSSTGFGDMLKRLADAGRPMGLLKVMRDGGPCMEAKTISKDTYTVWRWFAGKDHEDDTPPGNWQWDLADTQKIAHDWMATLYPLWELDRKYVDFFEFMNEPDPADVEGMKRAVAFVQACMEDAEAHGYKTAIWSWTAGLPRDPLLKPGECPQMTMILPTLKWAAEHGHVYSVHDGAINDERRTFEQAAEDKTALRYRYTKSMMDALGWPMPYVVITECYQESGYNRPLWDSWKWYLGELLKDDYVLGCAWFTLGSWAFTPGQDVNIVGQLGAFTDTMLSVPIVAHDKILPVPFVSQNGPGAQLSPNDCGPADLVMVERFLFGITRTVDDWWEATGAGLGPITIGQLQTAASKLGYTLKEDVGTLDTLRARVDAGIPVIALVKAKYLSRESFLYGHFVVVTGYTADDKIITHDPNQIGTEIGGPNVVQEDFENAWGRCHEDGNPDHIYLELSKSPGVSILAGLHLRPGGEIRDTDYQCLTLSNLKAAKVTTEANPDCVDVLVERGILPQNVVVRLFADMSDRRVLPNEYYDWMKLPISLFLAKGVNKFEIHNEPNLSQEGFGLSWSSPEAFAQWYSEVIHLIRENHTGVQVGFPGLSPQPDNETWLAACNNVIAASDFVCTHAYWEDPALMSDLAHGGNWKRYTRFNKPLYITECSNPSKTVAKEDKGKQYKQYLGTLTEPVKAVYFFVSSSPAFPYEAWVSEDGTISQIPYLLR